MAQGTCSVEGCERPREKRGWCDLHYRRWQRNGDPLLGGRGQPFHAPRECKRCTGTFTPTSSRSLYCSQRCRYKDQWERRRDQPGTASSARTRSSQWRAANRDRHRAYSMRWAREHPERYRTAMREQARRRAVGRGSNEIAFAQVLRRDPCAYCGGIAGEVDHIEPVAGGGENRWENLTAACKSCNSRKRTRSVLTFLLEVSSCPDR